MVKEWGGFHPFCCAIWMGIPLHKRCCFMALAPHLSLYIVDLVFIMACTGLPLVRSICCGDFVITW
jgi:hypothetical protein